MYECVALGALWHGGFDKTLSAIWEIDLWVRNVVMVFSFLFFVFVLLLRGACVLRDMCVDV